MESLEVHWCDFMTDAIEDGVSPKEMYEIKKLVDRLQEAGLTRTKKALMTDMQIYEVIDLVKNQDMYFKVFDCWYRNRYAQESEIDLDCDIYTISTIPESYLPMIRDAATAGVSLCEILEYGDSLDSALDAYNRGVPAEDIFA